MFFFTKFTSMNIHQIKTNLLKIKGMQSAKGVIKRLKELLKIKTDLELATILGVKPNTISSWKKRNSLQFETIIELCKENNIDLNELFYSDVVNYKSEKQKNSKEVKLVSSELHFQYLLDSKDTLESLPIFNFPFLEDVEIGFQVISENMVPTVRVSSYVICKRLDLKSIKPLEIYVIHLKNKGLFVHRFERVELNGTLIFGSDNRAFSDIEINPRDIEEVFVVRGAFLPSFRGLAS